jgi:hypothetical protein
MPAWTDPALRGLAVNNSSVLDGGLRASPLHLQRSAGHGTPASVQPARPSPLAFEDHTHV